MKIHVCSIMKDKILHRYININSILLCSWLLLFFTVLDILSPIIKEYVIICYKSTTIFAPNVKIEMAQTVEILPHGKQGPAYHTWLISWLLMTWRHKEPRHQ